MMGAHLNKQRAGKCTGKFWVQPIDMAEPDYSKQDLKFRAAMMGAGYRETGPSQAAGCNAVRRCDVSSNTQVTNFR